VSDKAYHQSFPMLGRAQAQIWSYSPRYRRPRHFHVEPELNIVVAGSACFGVGNRLVEVTSGELIGFMPGQDHELLHGSDDLMLFAIGVAPTLSSDVLRHLQSEAATPLRMRPTTPELRCLISHVAALAERGNAEQHIAELWERIHSASARDSGGRHHPMHVTTRRALSALSEAPELDRDRLARLTRANPSELSRHFHRDVGMTLVEYRTRLRVLQLIRLIDHSPADLTAAAFKSGFGSYSQCHRSFLAEFGCGPREFLYSGIRERMDQIFEPVDLYSSNR
jgi:AraC-like DNA-binding protein/mannose-6-phosphate isomerase-like protein (cupin superfamily)